MAKESFDKEIQFLRMLVLTSGAYNRQQFAKRLGISVNTFDKTLRRLKDIVHATYQQLPEEQGKEFAEAIRYRYDDSADPMLLFLFRAKSLKESESRRLSLVLAALNGSVDDCVGAARLLHGRSPRGPLVAGRKNVTQRLEIPGGSRRHSKGKRGKALYIPHPERADP